MIKNIKIKDSDNISIQAPMVTKLGLKAEELLIFALIHSFSKDGKHTYHGGYDFLCTWSSTSKQGAINILKRLEKKGYITWGKIKKQGIEYNSFSSNFNESMEFRGKRGLPVNEDSSSGQPDLPPSGQRGLPNNNNTNNNDNDRERNSLSNLDFGEKEKSHEQSECGRREKENVAIATSAQKKERRVPDLPDVQEYAREKNRPDQAELFFTYYSARGWKGIESWQFAFDAWLLRDNTNGERKPLETPKKCERKIDLEYEAYKKSLNER